MTSLPLPPPCPPQPALHTRTYRLNAWLFLGFLWLAVSLGVNLPHPYPIHFGLAGTPDAWAEGPGMWVLVMVRRANRLLGLVNTCMILTYSAVLLLIWISAHNPTGLGARVANLVFLAVLAGVVVIPLAEAWGLSRMIKRKLREEGLLT